MNNALSATFRQSAVILLLTPALATPDRVVNIEEKLWGTNAEGYVILRTETDNLGNHYSGRTKRYLDEYSKNVDDPDKRGLIGKRVRSTLVLDVTNSIDADAPRPNPPVSTTVNSKDTTLSVAETLLKFPVSPEKWDDESFRKLSVQKYGTTHCGRVPLVWDYTLKKEVFQNDPAELELTLDEVVEDMNCLFLKFSIRSPDEINETRIVCIPPRRTRQVHAHLTLKPFYLIAGAYPTLEAAQAQATALEKKVREKKGGYFQPEVWSVSTSLNKDEYLIAEPEALERIEGHGFLSLKEALGVDLYPRSSDGFQERFPTRAAP